MKQIDLKNIMNISLKKEQVDLNHIYIDGTKVEANANKYTLIGIRGYGKRHA